MVEKWIFSDGYIVFGDLESDFVTSFINDIGLNSTSLFHINLDDESFDHCDLETITPVRLIGWYNKFKQRKVLKKDRLRVHAYSVPSNKMMGLVLVRWWEKGNRTNFYW